MESCGAFSLLAHEFLQDLGRRVWKATSQDGTYCQLIQRMSVAVRGNAASVLGSLTLLRFYYYMILLAKIILMFTYYLINTLFPLSSIFCLFYQINKYEVNFQYRFKNPYPPKTAETSRRNGKILDSARLTNDERRDLLSHSGVTGESPLYIWYDLCQFDTVKDAVIDCMSCLNLIATELKSRLLADPSKGGVLQMRDLAQALAVSGPLN